MLVFFLVADEPKLELDVDAVQLINLLLETVKVLLLTVVSTVKSSAS